MENKYKTKELLQACQSLGFCSIRKTDLKDPRRSCKSDIAREHKENMITCPKGNTHKEFNVSRVYRRNSPWEEAKWIPPGQ